MTVSPSVSIHPGHIVLTLILSLIKAKAVVLVKLFKGNCSLVGRRSPKSIYNEGIVTFETGKNYDQKDADGFIKLNALRLQQRKRVK